MFRGSIPSIVSQIADEHMRLWPDEVYVGCSGSFTVERHLAKYRKRLHSNDVLLYSAVVGGFYSDAPYPLKLSEEGDRDTPYIAQYLDDPASALAAALIASKLSIVVGRRDEDSPYYRRLADAYERQFPELHAKTLAALRGYTLKLASYDSEDVSTWLDRIPKDAAVVAYPPFQATGAASYFQRDFARMERMFEWTPPSYVDLEGEALQRVYSKIADRRHWLFATNKPVPTLAEFLRGKAQTTNRAPHIHVYGSEPILRRVGPRQTLQPPANRHLGPDEDLGGRLSLAPLTSDQFQSLRSQYMNPGIKPGAADLPVAVLVDGVIVGCFAYMHNTNASFAQWSYYLPGPTAYMLSDFPVSGTKYPRISKLIVMAAISREAMLLLHRYGKKPFRSMTTTAFTKNPTSMKYRGVLDLLKREHLDVKKKSYAGNIPEGDSYYHLPYELQYGGPIGELTLEETLALWKKKHGKVKETVG